MPGLPSVDLEVTRPPPGSGDEDSRNSTLFEFDVALVADCPWQTPVPQTPVPKTHSANIIQNETLVETLVQQLI